jgi:hypothetical protein
MSAERPFIKFFARDWRGDQALRACSLAARGLWIEMMAIMHEAEPYGHLLLAGKPIERHALAAMVSATESDVERLLGELYTAGVYSKTKRGIIFSRRMVADARKSQLGKKVARIRWAQTADIAEQSRKRIPPESRVQRDSTDVELSSRATAPPKPARKPTGQKAIRDALATAISPPQADALIEHRQNLKQPLTVRAAELLANHYAAAPTVCNLSPDQAVDYQIERGWRGFDPEWVLNARTREAPRRQNGPAPPDEGAEFRAFLRKKAEGG